jgi:arylsulfatase
MLTIAYGAQAYVAKFLQSFKEFPPSQRPASFAIDQVMEKLQQSIGD